ncbi:MAG: putative Ig domain-containing protein [Planctomyces sp.]
MNDQNRTKILAGVLAAVIAAYAGRSGVNQLLLGPVQQAEKKLELAAADLEKQELRQITLGVARRNLDDWRATSLPENPLNAQRLYREWIESLARECDFARLTVEPGRRPDRAGRFLSVSVDVKAETDLDGLSRFLFLFDQTGLMHRVSELSVRSTGSIGNPRLEISFTAEGISVQNSGERPELFVRGQLEDPLTVDSSELRVQSVTGFPVGEPFFARIDRELIRVTATDNTTWKADRGFLRTKAAAHEAGAVVELLPVAWDRRERSFDEYANLLKNTPFAVPSPPRNWSPKIAGLKDQVVAPGEEVRQSLRAEETNPDLGPPEFVLQEALPGMTLDPATGDLKWVTDSATAPGSYSVTVVMTQPSAPDVRVEAKATLTVRIPNAPPVMTLPEKALVITGQKFELRPSASDDGAADQLKWALSADVPAGLTIDETSGQLSWTPPSTQSPGSHDVTVTVTDAGEPPMSASGKITLTVEDDSAALTLLTGAITKDDIQYAWFRNKGTNERLQLKVGEHIKVAELDAVIETIEPRAVLLRDDRGLWRLNLGETVRSRKLVGEKSDTENPADSSPAQKETPPGETSPPVPSVQN